MVFLEKILNIKNRRLIIKYILISLISYLYTFSALYLLVEKLNYGRKISFILVYGFAYLILYGVQLKYLFYKDHDSGKLGRYILAIIIFYLSANIFYNLGLYLGLHYLISTALTILILMPLRLFFYSRIVYNDRGEFTK